MEHLSSRSETEQYRDVRPVPSTCGSPKEMPMERFHEFEMIDLTLFPIWRIEAFSKIKIEPDREIAIERAKVLVAKSTTTGDQCLRTPALCTTYFCSLRCA